MTDLRKAAEVALDALETLSKNELPKKGAAKAELDEVVIPTLRQALEQSEWQELDVNEVIQVINENITDPSHELLQELYGLVASVDMYLQEKNSGS
jgi:hypothetical protein